MSKKHRKQKKAKAQQSQAKWADQSTPTPITFENPARLRDQASAYAFPTMTFRIADGSGMPWTITTAALAPAPPDEPSELERIEGLIIKFEREIESTEEQMVLSEARAFTLAEQKHIRKSYQSRLDGMYDNLAALVAERARLRDAMQETPEAAKERDDIARRLLGDSEGTSE